MGFYLSIWTGLWAPKGTPKSAIGTLNTTVVDILANPAVHQRFARFVDRRFSAWPADAGGPLTAIRKPKSKNGGRSSRLRTLGVSDPRPEIFHNVSRIGACSLLSRRTLSSGAAVSGLD